MARRMASLWTLQQRNRSQVLKESVASIAMTQGSIAIKMMNGNVG